MTRDITQYESAYLADYERGEGSHDAIILAVAHRQFKEMGAQAIRALGKENGVVYDLKYVLAPNEADLRL